jgi:hypothetical protein
MALFSSQNNLVLDGLLFLTTAQSLDWHITHSLTLSLTATHTQHLLHHIASKPAKTPNAESHSRAQAADSDTGS